MTLTVIVTTAMILLVCVCNHVLLYETVRLSLRDLEESVSARVRVARRVTGVRVNVRLLRARAAERAPARLGLGGFRLPPARRGRGASGPAGQSCVRAHVGGWLAGVVLCVGVHARLRDA